MPNRLITGQLALIDAQLRSLADPAHGASATQFFKEPAQFLGIRSPQLIALSATLYQQIKAWPLARRNDLCTQLWKRPESEYGTLTCYIYRRFARTFGEPEFRLFEFWLNRYASNWGHVDGISIYLLAPAIANVPLLAQDLLLWTKSPNRWVRRGAAVALVKAAKQGHSTALIFEIANALATDEEDLVQKGAGWLLKEAYPARPAELTNFLKQHRDWPRVVLRYAAEKMAAADKAQIL